MLISKVVVSVGNIAAGWYCWTRETGTLGPFPNLWAALAALREHHVDG